MRRGSELKAWLTYLRFRSGMWPWSGFGLAGVRARIGISDWNALGLLLLLTRRVHGRGSSRRVGEVAHTGARQKLEPVVQLLTINADKDEPCNCLKTGDCMDNLWRIAQQHAGRVVSFSILITHNFKVVDNKTGINNAVYVERTLQCIQKIATTLGSATVNAAQRAAVSHASPL